MGKFPLSVHGISLLSGKQETSSPDRKVPHIICHRHQRRFSPSFFSKVNITRHACLLFSRGLFQPSKFTGEKTKTRGGVCCQRRNCGFVCYVQNLRPTKNFSWTWICILGAYSRTKLSVYVAAELGLSCMIASKNLAATGNLATGLNTWVPDTFEGSCCVDPSALYDAWQLLSRRTIGDLKANPQHH